MTSLWNVYLFRFTFFQEAAMKNKSLDDDIRSKKTPSKKKKLLAGVNSAAMVYVIVEYGDLSYGLFLYLAPECTKASFSVPNQN